MNRFLIAPILFLNLILLTFKEEIQEDFAPATLFQEETQPKQDSLMHKVICTLR